MSNRYVEILVAGQWVRHDYEEISEGDILRLYEADGTPVPGVWVSVEKPSEDPTANGTMICRLAGRPSRTTPVPEYCTLMTLAEWRDCVDDGTIIGYDGDGYFSDGRVVFRDCPAVPSETRRGEALIIEEFTHVAWFNR